MKYLMITLMLFGSFAYAQESCTEVKQDVNTPVPAELKDKEICIRDPKTGSMDCKSTNEFKMVKRKQQFKVKERVLETLAPVTKTITIIEKSDENKNLLMLGARYDYTELSQTLSGNKVTLYSQKALVVDLSYYRRDMFDSSFGLGIGIDTNATPRAILGFGF